MSDVPPATIPPVPVEKPPEPTPAPVVSPAAGSDLPITRDTLVSTVDASGQPVTASIGDMEKSWLGRDNQVTPEQRKKLDLFEKAIEGGDPEASKELYASYLPKPEPVEATPDAKRVQDLENKVDRLTTLIQENVSPVVTQITDQARLHGITQEIAQGKHPLLARATAGPQLVAAQRKHYEELVRSKGHDPAMIPESYKEKIRTQSLVDVETFLSGLLTDVGGVARPAGPVSVNDQAVAAPDENFRPARYQQKPDGAYVEVSRNAAAPDLPAVPVTPASSGAAVGVRDETRDQGPLSLDQMRGRMGARVQTLNTIL